MRLSRLLGIGFLLICTTTAGAQSLRVSFDNAFKADQALGRAEPWVSRGVEHVPGKFGKAARIGDGGQLIFAAERNIQAGRGTLACWCRIPERPGPLDVGRLIFVQSKERGYWNYLATLEWQESVFRAMVFDFYHGHGLHDSAGMPGLSAHRWHHVALVWDQSSGVRFYLDGKLAGSTWNKQAWWERPTPHAIHLSSPGAEYDELCIYDRPLNDQELADLARKNAWQLPGDNLPLDEPARERLIGSLQAVGVEQLPTVTAHEKPGDSRLVVRQARIRQILDDKIPAWKVMDGRMNLFWPEWRAPVLGDVDYSGSEISLEFQPGQKLTHLLLRGLIGGCRVYGEQEGGYVSRRPIAEVPTGLHFLAAEKLPVGLTGVRIPRREGMKLQEIGLFAVNTQSSKNRSAIVTPITGRVDLKTLDDLATAIGARTLPYERRVFGHSAGESLSAEPVSALSRVHFVTEPAGQTIPLDGVAVRVTFVAPWKEDVWWLRVQDPVNPRRDLMHVPVHILNPTPGKQATMQVVLDFWDIMLDAKSRLWVELLPTGEFRLLGAGDQISHLALLLGKRDKVLAEFAHTQSQLAYSYWQLGSEGHGSRGSDPQRPGFDLLGGITHNRELKLTLEWVRRYLPDQPLVDRLWNIIYERNVTAAVKPRLEPTAAPEWAVWGRELLERFRSMAHYWADWQSADGQVGGGWNDDTDFPGVFICLPLLGDTKTETMFERIFDGIERTGYLLGGVARSPGDALHATDFLSWRAHLMLLDYGEPRHVERALRLTRELKDRWTKVDSKGHRRFVTSHYSEDGPARRPRTEIDSAGLIHQTSAATDSEVNRNFMRDPLFCAWYSRNPTVMKFVREMAEGDYARIRGAARVGTYQSYLLYSYFTLFGDRKFLDEPLDRFLRDRWNLPIWRRIAQRLPNGNRLDGQLLKGIKIKGVSEERLTTAYLITKDKTHLVRAMRGACERLEAGGQFRGGAAGGANDHFSVPGQAALSQTFLGGALTWLRPASIIPPIAVSWEGLEDDVAAIVLDASPRKLRLAAYNFTEKPRDVRMRVWELSAGRYRESQGVDRDHDDRIDAAATVREVNLKRAASLTLCLPPRRVHVVELEQIEARPRPDRLPDLAVGQGDIFYDKATDRLKVIVHNIGAAPAENVSVRFEDPQGHLLAERMIPRLEAPLDLTPKTAVVWLSGPTLHPVSHITARVDPTNKLEEITEQNNAISWRR